MRSSSRTAPVIPYDNSPNPDYWSHELHGAISYLGDGWDFTAHLVYEFSTPSAAHTGMFARTPAAAFGVGYRSGDQMLVDLTATKTFGKWELGPVAYFKQQTTSDSPGGGVLCATMSTPTGSLLNCGQAAETALGGLIGYDFANAVTLKVMVTDTVYSRGLSSGLERLDQTVARSDGACRSRHGSQNAPALNPTIERHDLLQRRVPWGAVLVFLRVLVYGEKAEPRRGHPRVLPRVSEPRI